MTDDLLLRILGWLWRRVGGQTLLSLLVLLVGLGSLVFGLAGIVRGLDASLLMVLSILGLLAGWLLARSPLSGRAALAAAAGLGLAATVGRTGQIPRQAWLLALEANALVTARLHWGPGRPLPDPSPALHALSELASSLGVLFVRLGAWLAGLLNGAPAPDPVVIGLLWGLAVWGLSVWAAWALRRREQPLAALVPAMALLGSALAAARGPVGSLLGLLAAALFLMAWNGHTRRERGWEARNVDYSEDLRLEVWVVAVVVSLALTILAGFSPRISLKPILEAANRWSQARNQVAAPLSQTGLGESLGLEQEPPPQVSHRALEAAQRPGLPREHLLGSGPELSEIVVMRIRTGELPPMPQSALEQVVAPPYYWRSLTYDRYNSRGWTSGPTQYSQHGAGQLALAGSSPPLEEVAASLPAGQKLVRQQVELVRSLDGLVYAAGELVSVDQPYTLAWRVRPPPEQPLMTGLALQSDVFGVSGPVWGYSAVSLLPNPTVEALKQAGAGYPQWVLNRYLPLPDTTPQRVLTLAQNLTATQPTPYERAEAIEAYLRGYTYNLDVPYPPSGQDVVDYFLFDLKEGYCDYFASAMVVLARAAGLPARLSVGYASGSYDAMEAYYAVSEADAHSWPEVYFPGYGWLIFEPTSGRPAIQRSGAETPLEASIPPPVRPAQSWWQQFPWGRLAWQVGGTLGLLFLAVAAWLLAETWRLRLLPPARTLAALYGRLYRQAVSLHTPLHSSDTPYELSAALAGQMDSLRRIRPWGERLTPAAEEARQLVALYALGLYSPHPPDAEGQRQALRVWSRLRWKLWLFRWLAHRRP